MCTIDAHLVFVFFVFFFLEFLWTLPNKHLAGIDGHDKEMDLKEPHSLPSLPSLPPEQGGLRKLPLNYSSYKRQLQNFQIH